MRSELTAKIDRVNFNLDNSLNLVFNVPKQYKELALELLEKSKDNDTKANKSLKLTIEPLKEKRSLNANSYMWVLCDKIAEKLNTTKNEVYQKSLREVGVFEFLPIKTDAVERWVENWNKQGLGYLSEKVADSKLKGYVNTINYYGSSTYSTGEMARLIENIVDSCHELKIQTLSEKEINSMIESWDKK